MQLLLTSAALSNIGRGGDTIIQTQKCVSPCAWVKLIFSVSRICHLCAGAMLSSRSIFPATRIVRVILEQGAMSSSQGKKNDLICACHPCASHTSVSFKKKNYPSQILNVILAQGPCDSVQRKIRRQAPSEVRTSRPALEGSIVSPLVNTMGGLSGGDVSGAASAPYLSSSGCLPEL